MSVGDNVGVDGLLCLRGGGGGGGHFFDGGDINDISYGDKVGLLDSLFLPTVLAD
jgi:hypothetical protein